MFRKAQEEERYEDCAVMRDIMQKYHIPCDTSLEDWRTDLWRFGYSGDVAINNLSVYMVEALTFLLEHALLMSDSIRVKFVCSSTRCSSVVLSSSSSLF